MFVRRAVCEPVRCILLSARRWASSCNHEHDCQGPDDVKYVRGASTKMNPSTILCPQNEALVKALA
ncbi:putative DNA polymerase beta-like, partial [Diplonema papillatum]